MDESNPYDAPQAQLQAPGASAPQLSMTQMLFGLQGRIRRKHYWLYSFGFGAASMLLLALMVGIAAVLDDGLDEGLLGISVVLSYVPMMWVSAALQAKRWHDRDKSAWWLLLNLVPLLNLWAGIEAGFLEGTHGPNRYGADPKA